MKRVLALALVAGVATPLARAQSIAVRIVERTGQQTILSAADAVLDLAVQANVGGGPALAAFAFDVAISGEADTRGTLARGLISNADGTYATTIAAGNTVGRHGLPQSYTYLAGISASFNGLINTSSGTFTNNPSSQEIGLVTGDVAGSSLLATPGMDPAFEGNPSSWSGYGSGASPAAGATAPIPAGLGSQYFGQGAFVDVYRFRYTVTDLADRTLNFTLQNLTAQTFTNLLFSNGAWGTQATAVTGTINLTGLTIFVGDIPAPGAAALLGLGGLFAVRRRR